ncbi:unnamed protein product [Adineta steineri]|uniref:Tripeptidyl peptidase II second Ig-like domain-containing protein n=1 Tax=Adineta steineri TaxID=433720 RepID=A0A814ITV8_9BILA|nr:unnamed protein product [Adineta steineri]
MTAGIDIFLVIVSPRKPSFISLKASKNQVKCPYLHELFYDNEYEYTLWMCFDTNKQYLDAGDVLNDGDFIIRMNNGGTGLFLHIEHKVEKLPTPNFYHSLSALHTQKKKILASSNKLQWGHQVPVSMSTVPEDKLTDDQGKLYEELISEQQDLNNYVLLHLARLQQLENQLKQQQQSHLTNDKKDEK